MSGYIQAGYLVTLLTLGGYGAILVAREKSARRRFARHDRLEKQNSTPNAAQDVRRDGEST